MRKSAPAELGPIRVIMRAPMTDWNAGEYHRLSEPQLAWGRDVLARVTRRGNEVAADVGCGTGRLTAELAERLPRGRVVGVDSSQSMIEQARGYLLGETSLKAGATAKLGATTNPGATTRLKPGATILVRADASALPFDRSLDLVFSTATFHWVHDHDRLFSSIFRALKPGGRLVAQCGGGPNLHRLYRRANGLMGQDDFASYFSDWRPPWHFADAETTRRRLETAGFVSVVTALNPSPVSFDSTETYRAFLTTVCVRHHVARLPPELQDAFTAQLARDAARDDPPLTLDYWRLDMNASVPILQSRPTA
jgi:trans-aconitate 2-methyltransferase